MKCPKCGDDCWRESVDVGVGVMYGPYGCGCGWSEDSSLDRTNQSNKSFVKDGRWTDQFGNSHCIERVAERCAEFGISKKTVLDAFKDRTDA